MATERDVDAAQELLDTIGDKLMETGYLTEYIEDGHLDIVSLVLEADEGYFEIKILVTVGDRENKEDLSEGEEDDITYYVREYIKSKKFDKDLAELGFDIDGNECGGMTSYLAEDLS
jgi:hypothetical protein